MSPLEEQHQAQINRSIRTIKAELEFLCDSSVISPQSLSDLLSRVPAQTALHAPISVGAVPPPTQNNAGAMPVQQMAGLNINHDRNNGSMNLKEKQEYAQPTASPGPPPPAYQNAPPPPQASWPPLAQATALYAYDSTDDGDLALQPNDHINITEYLNADWWKGTSTRTGREGIFPRSYVKIIEEKSGAAANGNNYGNMPLETSGMGNGEGKVPGKAEEQVSRALQSILWVVLESYANHGRFLGQEIRKEAGQRRHLRCRCDDRWQHRQLDLLVHDCVWLLRRLV